MSKSYITETAEFCIEGQFLEFVIKDGYKLKGMMLATPEGECYVKLAKHLRAAFDWRLPQGTWLQVSGERKIDHKSGEVKLKAYQVLAASRQSSTPVLSSVPPVAASNEAKVKPASKTILVCQKSDCAKRGGREVCQALQQALSDRGLDSNVTIRATGCMKNCKAGPNLVMPDKTRYTRISAAQVPVLVDRHFPASAPESDVA